MNHAPAANEIIDGIRNKLTVITDLFNFYQTIEDHDIGVLFRTKTFDGLIGIIDDCIDKLEGLKK